MTGGSDGTASAYPASTAYTRPRGEESHAGCQVWWATPRASPALVALLDDAERHRAFELARTEDRKRYVTAHALVRLLLGARTGEAAAGFRFDRTCRRCGGGHGKPRVAGGHRASSAELSFNLAHAGDRVVVAVAPGRGFDVGVDVESIPRPDEPVLAAVGPEILTPAEFVAYRHLDTSRHGHALAVWWTRKEAVLKATGDGLAVAPSSIEVTDPDAPPAVTDWTPADRMPPDRVPPNRRRDTIPANARRRWPRPRPSVVLRDLEAGPGYVGCVAVLGATSAVVTEHDADHLLGAA